MENIKNSSEKLNTAQPGSRPQGTTLAGRYVLREPVGRGGFSIVYDAVDLRTDRRVAVKECTIPTEKERFLREAKILEDFAGEDAIVTVLDFFEDEGSAYIVMEFIEGETLRSRIERSGRMDIEDTVRLMSPVMKTLGRMHEKGVIHRDISPDNLMVTKDGSLKLLDFGAARQYEESTLSRLVVKANYSPPEQMDAKGIFGSWSDVYSICGAIYFCITGHNPEDAISRLMLDDLKKPSELGAVILPAAEKTLMSGMALDSKERIRSMEQLRSELEKTYPILSEEEKKARKRKKRIKRTLAILAAVMAVSAVLVVINIDKIRVARHMAKGTETIILDGSSMSDAEFSENADKAEARIAALSGGRAVCRRIGQTIRIEIPADLFADKDPVECMDRLVSAPLDFYLVSESGGVKSLIGDLRPGSDVTAVDMDASPYPTIEFSDSASAQLREKLSAEEAPYNIIMICCDEEDYHYDDPIADAISGNYNFMLDPAGDGRTAKITSGQNGKNIPEYTKTVLTSDPLSKDFMTTGDWDVVWEEPGKAGKYGAGQVSVDEVRASSADGSVLRLKYSLVRHSTYEDSQYGKMMKELPVIIKNRLDILGVPYAAGEKRYSDGSIIIEVPAGSINHETAVLLGTYMYDSQFELSGKKYDADYTFWFSWLENNVELLEDGSGKYISIAKSDLGDAIDKAEILDWMNAIKGKGEEELFLTYQGIPVAKTDLDKAIEAIEGEKGLEFREWCAADGKEDELTDLIGFIIAVIDQTPKPTDPDFDDDMKTCVLEGMQVADADGNISCYDTSAEQVFSAEQESRAYVDSWNDAYKGELSFEQSGFEFTDYGTDPDYGSRLFIRDMSADRTDEEAIDLFCSFYKDNRDRLEDGTFKSIYYYFHSADKSILLMTNDEDELYIFNVYSFGENDQTEMMKKAISSNGDTAHLITDDTL